MEITAMFSERLLGYLSLIVIAYVGYVIFYKIQPWVRNWWKTMLDDPIRQKDERG